MEYRYNEGGVLNELAEYVNNTYSEHYVTEGFQIQDVFLHLNIAEPFCRANAIKYLYRFGDKNGKNKKDLLKALHYIMLLYHFSGMDEKS
jgi:hypothetical protein